MNKEERIKRLRENGYPIIHLLGICTGVVSILKIIKSFLYGGFTALQKINLTSS